MTDRGAARDRAGRDVGQEDRDRADRRRMDQDRADRDQAAHRRIAPKVNLLCSASWLRLGRSMCGKATPYR